MTIYTSEQIESKRYFTQNDKWHDLDGIAIAINDCLGDFVVDKRELIKKLEMDKEGYMVSPIDGKVKKAETE